MSSKINILWHVHTYLRPKYQPQGLNLEKHLQCDRTFPTRFTPPHANHVLDVPVSVVTTFG